MDFIIYGILLFIAGVASTMAYDSLKARPQSKSKKPAKMSHKKYDEVSQSEQYLSSFQSHLDLVDSIKQKVQSTKQNDWHEIENLISLVERYQSQGNSSILLMDNKGNDRSYAVSDILTKLKKMKAKRP